MSGIYGWFGLPCPDASPDSWLTALSAPLRSPLTPAPRDHGDAERGLGVVSAARGADLHIGDQLWVACDGAFVWRDPGLADTAAARGPAAAVAELYRRRGLDGLRELRGPFGLAIYDLALRRALLAVDRAGIQRLCYMPTQSGLVFGASIDSVAAHPAVSATVDPQALYDYLYFHMIPGPRTIYRDLRKLLPGQYLLCENGQVSTDFYWRMEYHDQSATPQAQLAEEFRALLRSGVKHSLHNSQGKVGNFLSGGTDSSTIAGIVTEVSGRPAETYSIGFEAEGYDESHYADIAVNHFGTRHHTYYVTPQDVTDAVPRVAAAYDEPFGNASAVPTYYCAKLAHADGVGTLIAGDGGDELFGGNVRYVKQKQFELYHSLPEPLRRGLLEPLAARLPDSVGVFKKLNSYIQQANLPLPDRMESYNFMHRTPAGEVLHADLLAAIDTAEPLRALREVYHRTQGGSALHRMLHLDLKLTLADNDLRKVNRMCELAGVAVHYPLLDDDMLEFSGRVPPDLLIKGFQLRYFFKDSLKDYLPADILKKPKHGFGLPFGLWLNTHQPLHDLAMDSLHSLRRRNLLNTAYIDTLLKRQRGEHASYYGVMIWVLMMLEQWLQSHSART